MFRSYHSRLEHAISRAALIVVVVVIILIVAVGGYAAVTLTKSSSPSSTSSTTPNSISFSSNIASLSTTPASTSTGSTSTNTTVPSSLTYETLNTPLSEDPGTVSPNYDNGILLNIYETLMGYNGSSSTQLIPLLAQNVTVASNGLSANFTLRSGIKFADGEPLNSTAVYFSLNRLLLLDASLPTSHGVEVGYVVQQLLNQSLSTKYGGKQSYTPQWENQVLGENFVQITGPMSLTINVQHDSPALLNILAMESTGIVAPGYVMSHDLAVWSQSSTGYHLPYSNFSGNESEMISQYFLDLVSTCNAGVTPAGCGATYLFNSEQGSQAGTGPYSISSENPSTGNIVLQANPSYWGGPYQYLGGKPITPQIKMINIEAVSSDTTRELDLESAARSGQAMAIDVDPSQLYDIVDRSAWVNNETIESIIPGVTALAPTPFWNVYYMAFASNVSNPQTGVLNSFQPFADIRFRLAFADAVNISEINSAINNNLGTVATSFIPPGIPPAGSFNSSAKTAYNYDLDQSQNYLLSAMMNPLTNFSFNNGTAAPNGVFNNSFGCTSLNSNNKCVSPTSQTITITYVAGFSVEEAVATTIAQNINNISSTYNMGLVVNVVPETAGLVVSQAVSTELSVWFESSSAVFPYVSSVLRIPSLLSSIDGWNLTELNTLMANGADATTTAEIVSAVNSLSTYWNQEVFSLWLYYPDQAWPGSAIAVMTSNVQGYFYNPSSAGAFYFASLY